MLYVILYQICHCNFICLNILFVCLYSWKSQYQHIHIYIYIYKTSLFFNLYDSQVASIEDRKEFSVFIRRQNSFQMGTPRSLMQSSVVFRNSSRRNKNILLRLHVRVATRNVFFSLEKHGRSDYAITTAYSNRLSE